ncbi:cyanophycin synthetase [Clostridium sp. BSD9I1]|uniref:cyanophycin synthetase n=1 Tax=Clostridium sp. BSD9I1 TaxID=2003589 RepID=UPI001646557A|nr:cyanophycin synthetase [Clostridium sp. BSD9I1]
MKVIEIAWYEGRNIYSHRPCIKLDLDLEGYSDVPSNKIENFNSGLLQILPELREHRCGIDEEGGFVKRLNEGTYLAHICEHMILAIQNKLGIEAKYGKAREVNGDHYYIIYEYKYKKTGIDTGKLAVSLINSLIKNEDINMDKDINKLKNTLISEELGPSTLAILEEAKKRGIPAIRLNEGSVFQLGYGSTSKLIEATVSNNTGCIPVDIACDKLLTKNILQRQCIPVADGEEVKSPIQMLMLADRIGFPVVLKPRFGNQGKGVLVNLRNEQELIKAYKTIIKEYKEIIIEKYVVGKDYRVCVVDGKVVAVSERIPPYVTGDGKSTIEQLIEKLNKDPRRGEGHEKPLTKIKINDELINYISKNSYYLESIPEEGEKISLRENANLSTGGVAVDYTDSICDENIDICVRAAKAVGLDICGIDVCCTDISKPIDGVIIEINAAPGIRMHEIPYEGQQRNVSGAIIDMLFKNVENQIPVVSVTGTNGKTTTTRLISYVLSLVGHRTGMTTTGGIYVNNKCISKGDTTGYNSAMTVLLNKDVDAAVLETARGGIIRKGLAYDLADVGVITNIASDHLGLDGINSIEELAFVKSLVGEAVKDDGYVVLNADDKMSMSIRSRIKSNIILFSKDKHNEDVLQHIKNGGKSIYIENNYICLENNEGMTPIIKVKDIKITVDGKLEYNIENAMAACAALIGLNIDLKLIRKGMKNFYPDEEHNPGRFNMYRINDITVILDYGHNIEGYKAVLEGAKKLRCKRLIGIIGVPGDRKDENILSLGKISGENFDYIYIKEDEDRRGRKVGEVAELLERGVRQTNFNTKNVNVVLNEKDALLEAIKNSRKGDLIIVFFEKYEPLLDIVKNEINMNKDINIKEVLTCV